MSAKPMSREECLELATVLQKALDGLCQATQGNRGATVPIIAARVVVNKLFGFDDGSFGANEYTLMLSKAKGEA